MDEIVYFSGSFDLFHVGHLRMIREASEISPGAKLIVGVNTDDLYLRYKGRSPIIPYAHRAEIISSLKYVDMVVEQNEPTMTKNLQKYGVTIYAICSEFVNSKSEERAYMEEYGGKVAQLQYHSDVPSSTKIKKKIWQTHGKS